MFTSLFVSGLTLQEQSETVGRKMKPDLAINKSMEVKDCGIPMMRALNLELIIEIS